MALETYYNMNPIAVVDTNRWDDRVPEVAMQFQTGPVLYTPLIQWDDRSAQVGSDSTQYTELLEGDVNWDEIAYDAMYIPEPLTVDSRMRKTSMARIGDKVQLHKVSSYFQQWKMSGGRDWQPIMRGVLASNVVRKMEMVSRNAFFKTPSTFWTYAGAASDFAGLNNTTLFTLNTANAWNLRLGQTGAPVVPGGLLTEKVVIIPPGSVYDFQESLATAANNEAALWRDAKTYAGQELRYEIGSYKNIRFVESPNDRYGMNNSVLYNCGTIAKQVRVVSAIAAGDGAPDPESDDPVDGTWYVGQKAVTHHINVSPFDAGEFAVNDIVTIHTLRTDAYGVTNGVQFLSGKTVNRRIVKVVRDDNPSAPVHRLSFDRPIMSKYDTELTAIGDDPGTYAYVTKGTHIGFCLAIGSGGGVHGNVNKPLEFYEPDPVDDFKSVWRFVWDFIGGTSVWEPHTFELHFTAVSLAKPGGIIAPPAP